jgi:ribosome maturation protein Sdo1
MSERLDYKNENDKKIFRDSLVDNAIELVDMLKCMNITNDPELEKSRKQLEQAMFGVSARELRESIDIRKDVKSQVDEILSRMSI